MESNEEILGKIYEHIKSMLREERCTNCKDLDCVHCEVEERIEQIQQMYIAQVDCHEK